MTSITALELQNGLMEDFNAASGVGERIAVAQALFETGMTKDTLLKIESTLAEDFKNMDGGFFKKKKANLAQKTELAKLITQAQKPLKALEELDARTVTLVQKTSEESIANGRVSEETDAALKSAMREEEALMTQYNIINPAAEAKKGQKPDALLIKP